MKPITFESIRNFLKTKKKSKKDGADTSFKRSDSFKRISIRKSYLDRGRNKRAAAIRSAATKSSPDAATTTTDQSFINSAAEVKHGVFVGRPLAESYRRHHASDDDCLLKNKSLQEINEICGGIDDDRPAVDPRDKYDVIVTEQRQPSNETEVQTLAIQVLDTNDSSESIYHDIEAELHENVSRVSVSVESDDDDDLHRNYSKLKMIQEDDVKSNFSTNSFFVMDDDMYDKADSKTTTTTKTHHIADDDSGSVSVLIEHRARFGGSRSSLIDGRPPFGSRSSLDNTASWKSAESAEMPSLVTFKTYCEPKMYLETSFDNVEPHSIAHPVDRRNISRTSLNRTIEVGAEIDSHTYRMPAKAKPVVIHIPAADDQSVINSRYRKNDRLRTNRSDKMSSNQNSMDSKKSMDSCTERMNNSADRFKRSSDRRSSTVNLNCSEPANEDHETSLNGKFTYEIYKELQKIQPPREPYNVEYVEDEGDLLANDQYDARLSDDDDEERKRSALEQSFGRLQIESKTNYFEQSDDIYDVLSPDDSIPYPIRLKTNPFTRQKELYSVNLGRIWKQLNLGQEEDLDGSQMQGNFKLKNESFKSMSSRDSGFSLTLTKPSKNLFRRRSKKAARRKPVGSTAKLSISRDGNFRREQNSSRRKKKRSRAAIINDDDDDDERQKLLQRNLYETFGRYYRDSRRECQYGGNYNDNDIFLREFEEFCIRRHQTKATDRYRSKNFEEFFQQSNEDGLVDRHVTDVDKFTQEISDLEAFFEEHLKRLKDYYLQKKQLNDRTINELYDHEQREIGRYETHQDFVLDTMYDTLKRKQQMYLKTIDIEEPSPSSITSSLTIVPESTTTAEDFLFPHPDKRRSTATTTTTTTSPGTKLGKRNKFQIQEVRLLSPQSDDVKYASIDFQNSQNLSSVRQRSSAAAAVPYADLQFPVQDFPREKSAARRKSANKLSSKRKKLKTVNISLSNIFPLVSSDLKRSSERKCLKCDRNERPNERDSDEFSENEFIVNSIGCEWCFDCNCPTDDCVCGVVDENGRKKSSAGSKWCTCCAISTTAVQQRTEGTNFIFGSTNKRKVKRKKSRRRAGGVGKNHSTLRRGFNYSNTSKYMVVVNSFIFLK